MQILVKPIISEKAGRLLNLGKYIFEVDKTATTAQIKDAVKRIYNVKVADVNIIRMPSKVKRRGRTVGTTKEIKKAIVTLIPGQSIEGITEPTE